jgi:hypothetical protein
MTLQAWTVMSNSNIRQVEAASEVLGLIRSHSPSGGNSLVGTGLREAIRSKIMRMYSRTLRTSSLWIVKSRNRNLVAVVVREHQAKVGQQKERIYM